MTKITDVFYYDWTETEAADFIEVHTYDNGGGDDWDEFHVWYSPSRRRYYGASGSGCSCSYIGEDYRSFEDLETWGRKAEVISAAERHIYRESDAREARTAIGRFSVRGANRG